MSVNRDPSPERPPIDDLFRSLAAALVAWATIRIPAEWRAHVGPEDLAQEVWLRAVRIYPTSFDPERSSPRAWLFAVAKRVLLEVGRSAAQIRERGADGSTTRLMSLAEVPASITSITTRVGRDDAFQRFLAETARLAEDDRQLMLYCGMEDLPLREAAERLGIAQEACGKRWQRLRARIAQWPVASSMIA
ncbi:MAG: RNA polymerase sigma factor [Planctomycetota bacterium]